MTLYFEDYPRGVHMGAGWVVSGNVHDEDGFLRVYISQQNQSSELEWTSSDGNPAKITATSGNEEYFLHGEEDEYDELPSTEIIEFYENGWIVKATVDEDYQFHLEISNEDNTKVSETNGEGIDNYEFFLEFTTEAIEDAYQASQESEE